MASHKNTEAFIKTSEIQVDQLAKQLADIPNKTSNVNSQKIPKRIIVWLRMFISLLLKS